VPLTLDPVPIGNNDDLTLRARRTLAECDVVIGEEHRAASTLLKKLGLEQKEIYLLNEHSRQRDIDELVALCAEKSCALISDCGTPNFCDPGADLVKALRQKNISITALPGPSSLTMLLSLSSQRLDSFVFQGFLPAEREARQQTLNSLKREKRAIVIFETPYRLGKLCEELGNAMPNRSALLALDLTLPTEKVFEGTCRELRGKCKDLKAEPVLLIYSEN
jgi:16S rRNA (cytidine1402-2'-O)-methyltransferase